MSFTEVTGIWVRGNLSINDQGPSQHGWQFTKMGTWSTLHRLRQFSRLVLGNIILRYVAFVYAAFFNSVKL